MREGKNESTAQRAAASELWRTWERRKTAERGLATQYRVEPVDERRLSVSEAGALTVDSEEARSGGNDGGIAGADLIRIEADGAFK